MGVATNNQGEYLTLERLRASHQKKNLENHGIWWFINCNPTSMGG